MSRVSPLTLSCGVDVCVDALEGPGDQLLVLMLRLPLVDHRRGGRQLRGAVPSAEVALESHVGLHRRHLRKQFPDHRHRGLDRSAVSVLLAPQR